MLSYRHSFHAGNHADVLKHTVQSLIIESLKEKDKPFLYLDTHAGAGRYQLGSEHASVPANISKASPVSGSRTICPQNWRRTSMW
ncbi:DNA (exogenous) processing protein [Escherichia coli]|uniref:DNA (Exogenous) processing protein n=1 Tax=Escherichia coli TaxID=562 RepID=A0A377AM76_ECOLX|nr:DNA (exogenous) processing protein [Escherichia coli]